MIKCWLSICFVAGINSLALAQEFWIQPDKFYFNPGETADVTVKVGANFTGKDYELSLADVQALELHTLTQQRDLRMLLKDGAKDLNVRLTGEGGYLIVIDTKRMLSKMAGESFTAYLKEEGLDDLYYQREKAKTSGDSATEFTTRYSKVILQSGARMDGTYKKVCHLPLEIIPDKDPASMKKGDPIRFTILYQGKPLFGAKVKVWNSYNHRTTVQQIYSQQNGVIETHVSNPGTWMVSVTNMIPSRDPKAQYRTFRSTLVFGVR